LSTGLYGIVIKGDYDSCNANPVTAPEPPKEPLPPAELDNPTHHRVLYDDPNDSEIVKYVRHQLRKKSQDETKEDLAWIKWAAKKKLNYATNIVKKKIKEKLWQKAKYGV